jgi:tight adherence protein B
VRRVRALLTALAVAGAVVAGGATAAEPTTSQIRLAETSSSAFPEKAYILSLGSERKLTSQNVTVRENGEPVHDLQVRLPGAGGGRVGVALLVDASRSMEGEPIDKAIAAARTFATRLPATTELAIVFFSNRTPVALPLTKDARQIATTLGSTPQLAYGTRMDDAIVTAGSLLADAGLDVGSIVVLSDGADVGSRATADEAVAAAREARARIFTVGLRSPQFDPDALRAFAAESGGSYSEAQATDDLAPIFRRLGERISSEYLVSYESFAGSGQSVHVSVGVQGVPGVATTSYTAPGIATVDFVADETWVDRLVQSPWFALLIGVIIVALVGFGVYTLVRLLDRRLERRMSRFVSMSLDERAQHRQAEVADELEAEERQKEGWPSLDRFRWYGQLESDVEIGRIRFSAGSIVLFTALSSIAAAIVAVGLTGMAWTAIIGVLPPIVIHSLVKRRVETLRREFAEQLPETLDVVSSALRAGHGLTGALAVAVDGSPEPSHTELGRALADERLGVPLDQALRLTARRMDSTDMTQVSLVAQLQREAGTNVAEVLDQCSSNIRHQMELRRLIRTLTAQGRMSRWIVSLLPLGLFLAIFLLNREYLAPLWETTGGIVAMIVAGTMVLLGSFVIKRIVEFDA